ncbi:hypothetical protein [Lachnotalea sp. AF33-28]|uniref:hypothetical protein n=1 Tax=Lachnotalea sp. AF33-28 TaxID=2292046 RepID=UPI000E486E87|nr:hypothetical protein [Lachnotalea sp. AF33-28]RHP32765.1 hypothetical protein DWZ56_12655 [Lachnotalea sp. AF33-28]
MQQEAVKFCCEATGQDGENVPFVVNALLNYLCCEFENGHSVDFGQDFSVFSVKKRDQILPPGSPRTPKAPKYNNYPQPFLIRRTLNPSGKGKKDAAPFIEMDESARIRAFKDLGKYELRGRRAFGLENGMLFFAAA